MGNENTVREDVDNESSKSSIPVRSEELRGERNKRLEQLFAEVDRGPKRGPVGRLKREEIYDETTSRSDTKR